MPIVVRLVSTWRCGITKPAEPPSFGGPLFGGPPIGRSIIHGEFHGNRSISYRMVRQPCELDLPGILLAYVCWETLVMKILVCGSRDYSDNRTMNTILNFALAIYGEIEIVEGEARGADIMAREWAKAHNIRYYPYPADWERYGKAAGPIRNQEMLAKENPDLVIAFPINGDLEQTTGTKDMVNRARKHKIPTIVVGEDTPHV